jgi:hypothetical protein
MSPDRGRVSGNDATPPEPRPIDTIVMALAAAAVVVWVSSHVSGFTTDSDAYLDVAANLRAGRGLVQTVVDFWRPASPDPLGMWPPLYPALVAAVAAFGVPIEASALAVTAVSFVAFGALFHRLAARLLDRPLALGATAIALTTLGVAVCSAFAWSEATYLALLAAGLVGIARLDGAEHPSRRAALAAGACFGAAALTRYAGMPVALAAVVLVAFGRPTRRGTLAFALGALVLPAAWVARDLALFGRPFGPALPAGSANLIERAVELAKALRWEILPAPLDAIAPVASVLLAILGVGLVRALVRGGTARAVAVVAALSLAVVAVATATSAINAPGGRYVAPALPFLGLAGFAGLWPARLRRGFGRTLAALALVALAALSARELASWGRARPVRAVASLERRNDRAALRALVPPGAGPVISDAGHALRLASGRPAVQIPPAAYRPRPFGATDLARWQERGSMLGVVVRGGENDSTLRALGARADSGAGRFVRFVLPRSSRLRALRSPPIRFAPPRRISGDASPHGRSRRRIRRECPRERTGRRSPRA